jgi:hypothetical protein
MFVRVVRFTDVDTERVQQLMSRMDEAEGPPEGVPSTGVQFLHDEEQGTAIVLQLFESMDDLKTGEEVFAAMDPAQTPGTRASVDRCEMKVDLKAPTG